MIDLTVDKTQLQDTVKRAKEKNIIIPTFAQMKDPSLIPDKTKEKLKNVGLWDINPLNLFRITWKNEPIVKGGQYSGVNYLVLPESLTGVKAKILVLVGKWLPTGSHKVGAAFGCLAPRLVTGQFNPIKQKAVWPSTGNYCRGGAYDSALLGCESIAILPEEMSQERFDWLANVAGETIKTVGSESNVKEIFDKCWELRNSGEDLVIFNQFDEFGNYLWHYEVTGHAIEEILQNEMTSTSEFRGLISSTGSGGTIASGDYLKKKFPNSKIMASEALQCPTLSDNGFGAHRIEGIGDKHIPWVHNVKNTDLVVAIDDNAVMDVCRLFNEPEGKKLLAKNNVPEELIDNLNLLGLSSIANIISAIKMAKYYEMDEDDVMVTIATDSMEMYTSRLDELTKEKGQFTDLNAAATDAQYIKGVTIDHLQELTYNDRKRIHNLKYYTWVEQQGKTYEEINQLWYDKDFWVNMQKQVSDIDELIIEFNNKVGL